MYVLQCIEFFLTMSQLHLHSC